MLSSLPERQSVCRRSMADANLCRILPAQRLRTSNVAKRQSRKLIQLLPPNGPLKERQEQIAQSHYDNYWMNMADFALVERRKP